MASANAVSQELHRRAVEAALAALPPQQRRAIELAYYGRLSQKEIAERLQVSAATVAGWMRLGMMSLHAALLTCRSA
jgi:RNA polymerase sigma-70 factor (ECF subfamily)